MADVICLVAFRTDTDRAVRYKKIPVGSAKSGGLGDSFDRVRAALFDAYQYDEADFVSIRFIREKTKPSVEEIQEMFKK